MKNSYNRYNIGIIGYGGFGKFLHNSWKEMDNIKILAVADKNPACRPEENIRFYEDWQELIKDPDIDIVSIVTPPSTHGEIACRAMEEGKNVLIEKPMAINLKEAKEIIKKRDETGKVATVNYMMRFNPMVMALEKLSKDGIFGELRRVNVENYAQDSSLGKDHWFWDKETSGGILVEHGVHFIDLINCLTDQKYKEVTGMAFSRNSLQEDQVMASILYDRGLMATHYHSFSCPGFFEATSILLGYDLARIKIAGWIPLWGEMSLLVKTETKKRLNELPRFKLTSSIKVGEAKDDSRPVGWGNDGKNKERNKIYFSGKCYEADEMISATFDMGKTKGEVYAGSVRGVLEDLTGAIENPEHKLGVTLEEGLESLEIAILASQFSHK